MLCYGEPKSAFLSNFHLLVRAVDSVTKNYGFHFLSSVISFDVVLVLVISLPLLEQIIRSKLDSQQFLFATLYSHTVSKVIDWKANSVQVTIFPKSSLASHHSWANVPNTEHDPTLVCLPFQAQLRSLSLSLSVYHAHCLFSLHPNILCLRTFTHADSCAFRPLALPSLLFLHFSVLKLIYQEHLPWPQTRGDLHVMYSLSIQCLFSTAVVLVISQLFLFLRTLFLKAESWLVQWCISS